MSNRQSSSNNDFKNKAASTAVVFAKGGQKYDIKHRTSSINKRAAKSKNKLKLLKRPLSTSSLIRNATHFTEILSPKRKCPSAVEQETTLEFVQPNFVLQKPVKMKPQDSGKLSHSKNLKLLNSSVAISKPNAPLVTSSSIRKKSLPSKPDDVSQNWKAFLKARSERWKQSRPSFWNRKSGVSVKKAKEQPEIWFDDVDEILLDKKEGTDAVHNQRNVDELVKPNSFTGLTKVLAMDCEMVGVGSHGRDSIVARVSIVNQFGQCVYDKYVAPTERVTDYRTAVSGIRAKDIAEGVPFKVVQKEVSDILRGRTLVGHAVHHDLKVLFLDHPRNYTRDSSEYKPFRKLFKGGTPSLKKLSEKLLQVHVQEGEHNSVQDAQAAMRLYTMHRREWESSLKFKRKKPPKHKRSKKNNL